MYLLFHKLHCPYCIDVRLFLDTHNINYQLVSAEEGHPNQNILLKLGGKKQVPFLIDFNTGKVMYESKDIMKYISQREKF